MKHLLAAISLTLFFVLSSVGAVEAQFPKAIAQECVDAIKSGDADTVKSIAEVIKTWGWIGADPNTKKKIISNGEQCLNSATGEIWKYLEEYSLFLPEAEVDSFLVEKAAQKKEEEEEKKAAQKKAEEERAAWMKAEERLSCEIHLAEIDVSALESEKARFQGMRHEEAALKTYAVCFEIYKDNPSKALLEPVCNDLFMQAGVPDTAYPFDEDKLSRAKVALYLKVLEKVSEFSSMQDTRTQECKELLAEH